MIQPAFAFPLALALIAFSMWLAPRLGAVARVSSDRHHRQGEVPRLAGPAILLAVLPWCDLSSFLVLAMICAIGTWDDIKPLKTAPKAALLLLPCAAAGLLSGDPLLAVLIWPAAVAMNLFDHADGMVGGLVLAAFLAIGGELALAFVAVTAAYLMFNFPPARTFLGDGGAMLLGAALLLVGWQEGGVVQGLAWLVLPIADAARVTLKRIAAGRRPWVGGTDHAGHLMLGAGLPGWALPAVIAACGLLAEAVAAPLIALIL